MVSVQGRDWPWQIGAVPGPGPSNDKVESIRGDGFRSVMFSLRSPGRAASIQQSMGTGVPERAQMLNLMVPVRWTLRRPARALAGTALQRPAYPAGEPMTGL